MIRFHCLECGMLMQANESAVGRAAKCPGCGAVLEIPKASTPVPPPPPKLPRLTPEARETNSLPTPAPAPPPIAVPPPFAPSPPEMTKAASSESLSLDELLGSTSAVSPPPIQSAAAMANLGDLEDDLRTSSKTASKTARKSGAKSSGRISATSTAAKRGKTATKTGAGSVQRIRNVSIAAIAAGAIGLALFAVPYAGAAIGAIGAVVGFYAVSLASTQRKSPMGLAMAGAAVSVVAAGFGGYWTFQGAPPATLAADAQSGAQDPKAEAANARNSPASDFSQFATAAVKTIAAGAVADARNPLNFATAAVCSAAVAPAKKDRRLASSTAKPAVLRFQDPTGAADKATAVDAPAGVAPASGDAATAPAAVKAPIVWAAADKGEAQGNDDVKITVSKVVTGVLYYHFGENAVLGGRETTQPFLHIWLKVQNNQTAGAIDYKGWSTLPDSDSVLTDDKGAEIKRFDVATLSPPGQHATVVDSRPIAKIEITQSNEDVIIFHLPAEGAEYVRLKLSGKPAGLSDDLYFQIPRSMIKAGETANPLLPLGNP